MNDSKKELPALDMKLALTVGGGLPSFHAPDVREPFRGRDGTRLANQMREKYFRLWHTMVIEQLAIRSGIILNDHAQEMLDQEINRMLDRYINNERHPVANTVMWEITEMCIKNLVAQVRAILDNHPRRLGEII